MLSPETIAVVKGTVPLLSERGLELAEHFYRRLFAAHPEVRPLFEDARQRSGHQPRALAAAIVAYARHVERPEAISSALDMIARKHAASGVRPEHYPVVGEHLLGSMVEVLGDAATDEVLRAWGEAYHVLAGVLIGKERPLEAATPRADG